MTRLCLDKKLQGVLDGCGLPYSIKTGGRHYKIIVGGRLAAILPFSISRKIVPGRAHQNIIAQIKRIIREVENG